MSLQRYVSEELTHFVGRSFRHQFNAHEQQYQLLVDILRSGRLGKSREPEGGPGPEARLSDNEYYRPSMVCFSDIPLPDLGIHMGKFSRFGLAFAKGFLVARGANPVFYAARNAQVETAGGRLSLAQAFDQGHAAVLAFLARAREEAAARGEAAAREVEAHQDFLVRRLFAYVKFYDEGLSADDDRNYYMEREWRVHGVLAFTLADVRRVVFPERFAKSFRADLPEYYGEITFS